MKLFFLILKDLRVLERNPKTILLLLIGPMIIMMIIGLIFSASAQPELEQLSAINVGVCDNDKSELSGEFKEFLGKNFNTKNASQMGVIECETGLRKKLDEGTLMAVVIIPDEFEEGIKNGEAKIVEIEINNGKPQLAMILSTTIGNYIGEVSKNVSSEFVSSTWTNLTDISSGLDSLSTDLETSKGDFDSVRYKLKITQRDLNNIDTETMEAQLNNAQNQAANNRDEREQYKQDIDIYLDEIDDLQNNLLDARYTLNEIDADLIKNRDNLIQTRQDLQTTHEDAECDEADNPPYTGDPAMDEYITRWVVMCQNIETAIADINILTNDIYEQRQNVAQLQGEITDARNNLNSIETKLVSLQYDLDDTTEIDQMQSDLNSMERTIDDLKDTKENAELTLGSANDLLNETLANIDVLREDAQGTSGVLKDLTSRSTSSVITPISARSTYVFKEFRKIDAFFPAVLSIVIMFVSVLFAAVTVIREIENGTMKRLKMSPVMTLWIVLSKVFVTLLMVSLQIIVLFAIALMIFNVSINYWMIIPAFFASGLLAVTASAIGMVIASVSKTENTAILASLVICIPLMFLTGVFFPWELMIPIMRIASLISPLTNAVNILNTLLIYSSKGFDIIGVLISSGYMFVWCVGSIIVSTLFLRRKNM